MDLEGTAVAGDADAVGFDRDRPGGSEGGLTHFLVGAVLFFGGLYLVFSRVVVHGGHFFGGYFGSAFGGGMVGHGGGIAVILLPFVAGIATLFVDVRSKLGWGLMALALALLTFNIVASLDIYFQPTSLPVFLAMFGLVAAGLGLVLRSFFRF